MKPPRSPQQIIDAQVRSWALEQRHSGISPTRFHPVITVSRAFGARGDELAKTLGDRTGFDVWDREIVNEVADAAGGDVRIMESLDERRRRAIDDAVRGFLRGVDHTNAQYFRALARVVRTIGEHGRAVVVGRGANYFLAPERALRIRVTAPLAWRAERYAASRGLAVAAARDAVQARDRERTDFVAHFFRRDIDDSADYDAVLNSASLEPGSMADLVLALYRERFGLHPVAEGARL